MDHPSANRVATHSRESVHVDAPPGQGSISIRLTLDSLPSASGKKAVLIIIILSIAALVFVHTSLWAARVQGAWTLPALLSMACGLMMGAPALMIFCGLLVDQRKGATFIVQGDLLIISSDFVERWRLPRPDIQKVRLIQGLRSLHFDATRPAHRMLLLAPCPALDLVTEHGTIRPLDGWLATTTDQAASELATALSVPLEVVQEPAAIAAHMDRPIVTPLTATTKSWRMLMLSLLVATGLILTFFSFLLTEEMRHGPWAKVRGAVFSMHPNADGRDLHIQYSYVVDGQRYHNDRLGLWNESDNIALVHLADTGRVGSPVDVYYNPSNPADSLLVPHTSLAMKVFTGLGTLFALGMCMAIWRGRPTLATDALLARYPQPVHVPVQDPSKPPRPPRKPAPPLWRLSLLIVLASVLFGLISYWALLGPLRAGRFSELKTEEDLATLLVKISSTGVILALLLSVLKYAVEPVLFPMRKSIAKALAALEKRKD